MGTTIEILSEDLEVQTLKGFIHAADHLSRKGLTLRHLQILMAVEMLIVVMSGRSFPRVSEIQSQVGMKPEEFAGELSELVEMRYLHETIPTFGPLSKTTYKIGPMGGSLMKRMLRR